MQCLRDIANSPAHILTIAATNGVERGVWERAVLRSIRLLLHLAPPLWGFSNALITVTFVRRSCPIGNASELIREVDVYPRWA